jgi:hypothetical protein
MFKVQAHSLDEYFDADPARKGDLLAVDALIRETVPGLERWFYAGAPAGDLADRRPGPAEELHLAVYVRRQGRRPDYGRV